jgi:hypothetical protein
MLYIIVRKLNPVETFSLLHIPPVNIVWNRFRVGCINKNTHKSYLIKIFHINEFIFMNSHKHFISMNRMRRNRVPPRYSWKIVDSKYYYLYIQCLSLLKLWVRIQLTTRCIHYVIKFVSDLRQVGGFERVLWFPPPIKLTATI